ncbi:coiled-coil domain-containing protein 138 isoform X4 [Canis lupus familiaris]|uniref:coiled-coil domain-containing protein 138 isoform X4 n=1 Tax=Canis lupus familiaris TaxID=9615 RepID=UPI0003AE3B77|nr:coiled-coil domain-containing protein 138 isoform X4 [Canis lupus familiaris]XP_038406772.1 coiled-coil domain-containing protein 138 isoform X4 [Canis lupus familiaris]XP_038536058.1 coiled-coil domain-containing protein 138 isoform X4 [Canis lupus familiaris]|eukprot:XP_022280244.1 coiled-coil domain-containing protein 138 isoform X3 [Canis lupus familiaris]
MEPRLVKPPGQDLVVERLKSRYGLGGSRLAEYDFSNFDQARWKRRSLISPDDLDIFSSGDKVGSSLRCHSDERKHCTTPLCSSFKLLNVNCLDDELDSFQDLKQQETKEELIENDPRISTSKLTKQSFKDIEKAVPQPTNLASNLRNWTECCSDESDSPLRRVSYPTSKAPNKQRILPHQINQIYDELFQIHQKLQQHDAEVEHLTEVLKERKKESKRLRSSFDALKELNDSLKKQLNEVSEENKKMEIQAKRVQARLDNLQRKYEFLTIQRLKGNSHAANEMKSLKQDKVPVSKTHKVPLNAQVYELLTVFMDWISDHHLSKIKSEESGMDGEKPLLKFASQRNDIREKCIKLLPLMTEQLQWMPFVNTKLHEPFVKFIYWSLRQLDAAAQHSTMTSTLRRLGEDIFKGVVTKGIQDNSLEHSVENKPKTAAFFKSSNLPLRFLSTLIVLKTVTQADYLAQAFDSLCLDLKTDEGKVLFLEYQAVPVILNHLRISSKGLLSNVIDSLLQMTVESKSLQPFLEACSNTLFFRTCSVLLRTPKLDLQILEKLSIILQKLSKIKSNKKLFELFTIHLMLQELQRTTHPEHAFLCINLNSTLFNLGLTKCNSLASNASH